MTNLSRRDRMIAAVGGVALMYALAAVLWFMGQEQAWKTAAKRYEAAAKKTQSEKKLISQRQKWNAAYDEEREKMPVFSEGAVDVDTHWLRRVNALAHDNHVSISQSQAGQQVEAGDVFEQPIDVKRWESTISSLVKFMHALECETNAMFDVREMSVKPSSRKGGGFLTGSLKLACAYMHGEAEEEEVAEEKSEAEDEKGTPKVAEDDSEDKPDEKVDGKISEKDEKDN